MCWKNLFLGVSWAMLMNPVHPVDCKHADIFSDLYMYHSMSIGSSPAVVRCKIKSRCILFFLINVIFYSVFPNTWNSICWQRFFSIFVYFFFHFPLLSYYICIFSTKTEWRSCHSIVVHFYMCSIDLIRKDIKGRVRSLRPRREGCLIPPSRGRLRGNWVWNNWNSLRKR